MGALVGEAELVRRFQAGDASAFAALLAHHEPQVLGLLRRLVRDASTAEDLCQETFLRVLKGLPHFRAESGLGTWIYRVAHNAAVDHLRAREPGDSLDARAEEGYDPPAAGPEPPAAVQEGEMRRAVDAALSTLPAPQREVLHLLYWDELSVAEIAGVTGLPEGTVKTHLFRGRQALRGKVEGLLAGGAP